jgi:predicted transcriptional regulator
MNNSNKKSSKTYNELERIVRGFSNHRRIQIMELLQEHPELSVTDITGKLRVNFKTISEHMRRLAIAGLILKQHRGATVCHALTKRGKEVLKFLRILE